MTTRLDSTEILYTYLASVSALLTFVSGRIYGPPGDIPDGITEACRFICFTGDGGSSSPDVPMGAESFTFYCFGATQADAMAVFNELHDTLQRASDKRVTVSAKTALIRFVSLETGPNHLPSQDPPWPRVVARFRMVFCERGIT